MKQWANISFVLGLWSIYVNAAPMSQPSEGSIQDVCNMLTSFSKESQMLTKFNGVFFGDFKSGKNAGSLGPLAIGGSFTGENAFLNQRNQRACVEETSSAFEHHGLVLRGAINSSIKVNGFAHVADIASNNITLPLRECSVKSITTGFDFEATRTNVLRASQLMAGMFPNWTIDKQGVLVNIMAEGTKLEQPFNVFSLPTVCSRATCERKSYFDCAANRRCEIPSQVLSDIDTMMLGKGVWTGPVEQVFPQDKMIVFNIPVMEGETIDIRTTNPSAGLNACNTLYNFYAVTEKGANAPHGKFTLMRNSENPLAGMIIAPQAHIIDGVTGSFSGQVIVDSYEAVGEGVTINDYVSTGNQHCQTFTGCSAQTNASKLVRRDFLLKVGYNKDTTIRFETDAVQDLTDEAEATEVEGIDHWVSGKKSGNFDDGYSNDGTYVGIHNTKATQQSTW